ncbi:bromoperoxidase [Comamonas testosteroni]|uniref:Bromoperoxidase n=1 Tax=Comamonas testosteroni TaxID=285 RepID=A0A0L7MW85_COMTE|nr:MULTISPECIES: alpha/beta hydrolase [Comamonas]KOC26060.1 bromoperoxidase [Comamonas testosteroni]KWT73282.1 Non-heme chloroperoxidase [Comamonas testosteroni]MDN5504833.1 alpha/beta hydrolase [Comamonas sp.]MDN5537152.1 alpha/beta hydrolase [Comamonas sp.]
MPYIELSQSKSKPVQLHYQDFGDGPPVVLIHGWPLSGRTWEPQVADLVDAGFRVIAYDRRGFGGSSQPWDGYDYDSLASDLNALITELALKNVCLVGFSMGGGEVARYIGTYGTASIRCAVFAAAVPPFLLKCESNPQGAVSEEDVVKKEEAVLKDRLNFLDEFTQKFFSKSDGTLLVSEAQREYAKTIAAFASPKGTHDCIASFSRTDFRDDLRKIDVPTLVIHGDSDRIVPLEVSGARTHDAVKGSEIHIIKNGPHGCNLSHAEEFNRALIDFIAAH